MISLNERYGYTPLFCTAICTTVHKICDARHGFSSFVLTIFARGGGELLPRQGAVGTLEGRTWWAPCGVFRVLFVQLPEVCGRIGTGFLRNVGPTAAPTLRS